MTARILVLSMHFQPEPNFVTADVARALTHFGAVTVITAHPNYPFGRFYKGSRPWRPRKTVEHGVTVWRLPFLPDHSTSVIRRGLSYLSFALAATLFAPFVAARPTAVWVYHTPFTTALAALWFKWVMRVPVIYTSADLWPESLGATQVLRSGSLMRALYGYSRWINRMADLIICSTRGTLERYARDGVERDRLAYVPVWVDGIPRHLPDRTVGRNGQIVYAGNLGPAQSLETVVRAAARMRDSAAVTFHLYGAGASEADLRQLASELGATNVHFHGRVDPETAFRVSANADAQIVSLARTPLFAMTVPSKLAFAIAAGAPILYALEGEAATLADESGLGLAFDATDPTSLVEAIGRLQSLTDHDRDVMRERGATYFARHFDKDALLQRYMSLFAGVMNSSSSRAGAPQSRSADRLPGSPAPSPRVSAK